MVERLVLVPLSPRRPVVVEDLPVVELVLRGALAGVLEGALRTERGTKKAETLISSHEEIQT